MKRERDKRGRMTAVGESHCSREWGVYRMKKSPVKGWEKENGRLG